MKRRQLKVKYTLLEASILSDYMIRKYFMYIVQRKVYYTLGLFRAQLGSAGLKERERKKEIPTEHKFVFYRKWLFFLVRTGLECY